MAKPCQNNHFANIMSPIMDLNALGVGEFGGASSRARVLNSSSRSQYPCFYNPNIMPSKSQCRPSTTVLHPRLLNASLPSVPRDCAQRLKVIRDASKDDIGETKLSDLRTLLTPQAPCYTEYGLTYYSVLVACCEISWLLKNFPEIPGKSKKDARCCLRRIIEEFSIRDALEINRIEENSGLSRAIATKYFLMRKFDPHTAMVVFVVFEDLPYGVINHLAQALMLVEAIKNVEFHVLEDLIEAICGLMAKLNHVLIGSSIWKTMAGIDRPFPNFRAELSTEIHKIFEVETMLMRKIKLANVVTNYINHENDDIYLASNDWPRICEKLLLSLGMSTAPVPQFEIHDYMLKLSEGFTGFNNVLMGLTTRSTMPLVLFDDFGIIVENLNHANLSFHYLIDKFPDTCIDSSVLRNMNIGLECSLIAYRSMLQGIAKLCRKIDEDNHHFNQDVRAKSMIQSSRKIYGGIRRSRDEAQTTPTNNEEPCQE